MFIIVKRIEAFLKETGMHPELTDMQDMVSQIRSDMVAALKKPASSLLMLPTYLQSPPPPQDSSPIIAIDAGGTNFRRALVSFKEGRANITEHIKRPMPGTSAEITSEQFYEEIARHILPLTNYSDKVAFCFSYSAEITPNRDGIVAALSKEVKVIGIAGSVIGTELKKKLKELGCKREIEITVINDTTAAMLGGAYENTRPHDGAAGLILGTGFNACYEEKAENIKKLSMPGDMIINTEAGCFNKVIQGEADRILDASTDNPNDHLCEKMVSGAYLGRLVWETARLAAGLFTESFREKLEASKPFKTPELEQLMAKAPSRITGLCKNSADVQSISIITDRLYRRAARITVSFIGALAEHTDKGRRRDMPYLIAADGSVFYKARHMIPIRERLMTELVENTLKRHAVFQKSSGGNLTGAAIAAVAADKNRNL